MKKFALITLLLLLMAAVPAFATQADDHDASHKATAPTEEGVEHVPASNPLGMMLMVMLVLTASTVALLGGGLNGIGGFGQRAASASIEFEPATPEPEETPEPPVAKRAGRAKGKLKAKQRQMGRQSWRIARSTHTRPGGRRSGPGCRGVR